MPSAARRILISGFVKGGVSDDKWPSTVIEGKLRYSNRTSLISIQTISMSRIGRRSGPRV
jgi:hypothetical protein